MTCIETMHKDNDFSLCKRGVSHQQRLDRARAEPLFAIMDPRAPLLSHQGSLAKFFC